ncbi:MAG TPA: tetratricopeptide repeat protein [Herpetosiphonaceae bacterium]
MQSGHFAIPRFSRSTLLTCAGIALLLVPLALYVDSLPSISPAVSWLFFIVRVIAALVLIAVWALLNVPPRKPITGHIVVGVARFGDDAPEGVHAPRRTLLQWVRPRPTWEPVLNEEGETVLPLPDGGIEVGEMLAHAIRKLIAPIPNVALVTLPYIADEREAILAGDTANADIVLWGVTERAADNELVFAPQITLTKRLEMPIPQSDLRLCGLETIALPVQRMRVWQARYVGVQQLWSFLLGLIFYTYNADEEALNELAAVHVTPEANGHISPAIAAAYLLSGNLHVIGERWEAAIEAYRAIADEPTFSAQALVNLGVLHALRGETVAALDQLTQAVEQAPMLALAHHNLAVLQQRVDRQAEAEKHFDRAIELDPSLSESYRGLAAILRAQGNAASARQILDQALAIQPMDVEARRDLAALLIDGGNLGAAQQQLERALALDPHHAATYYLLGLLCEQSGDTTGALEALEQAIAIQPNYADAYAALARVYKQTGGSPEALSPIARTPVVTADARAHMDLGLAYFQQFRDAEAEHEFRAAIEKEPLYAPAHVQLGKLLRRNGRTAEALEELKTALHIDAHVLTTYHELAELRAEQGELERAAQTLEQALRIAPTDARTAYLLGNIRATQARESGSRAPLEQAIAAYHRATALDPSFAAAQYNLAIAALTDGDVTTAVDSLRQTISINPEDGEAHRLLATIYNDLRRSREALQLMTRAAELLPGHVPTLIQLSQIQRQHNQIDEAITTLRQAQKAEPQNVRVLRELGSLYVAARQLDRAISTFNRARDIAPDQAETHFALGVAYRTAGRLREAIEAFEAAIKRDPRNAAALTQLAETLYSAGEQSRAVTMLQQAITINRDDPQLYYALGQMYGALGQSDRANEAYRMYAELRAAKA